MRIAFVQYGDYAEAYHRLKGGGEENYYAQKYSVDFVESLSESVEMITICIVNTQNSERQKLAPKLQTVGVKARDGRVDEASIVRELSQARITHLILTTPLMSVLRWAIRAHVQVLPLFADSWEKSGLVAAIRRRWVGWQLSSNSISIVCNHNLPASMSLYRMGVAADKVIAWDWPHALTPEQFEPKHLSDTVPSIVHVGLMAKSKGTEDVILAADHLKRSGFAFSMTLIGGGEFETQAREMVERHGLQESVEITGRRPHSFVLAALKTAALSLVPSHHDYPEGLPMTIYEALATRTPLVLSDHPMFELFFANSPAAVTCAQRNPTSLADCIRQMLSDANRYRNASAASEALWHKIRGELTWGEVISTWLDRPAAARQVLSKHSLKARMGTYGARL